MSNSMPTPQGGLEANQSVDTLPQEVATALRDAYQEYAKAVKERSKGREKAARRLANLAAAGRKAEWSVRALAEPCGVTPERLRQIINDWSDGKRVNVKFPKHSSPKKSSPRPQTKRAHLTEEQAAELAELAPKAKQNTGSRPLDSKYRLASEKFSELIKGHHERGVTWREMSDATRAWKSWPLPEDQALAIQRAEEAGEDDPFPPTHKVSGLRMRAARHGYGKGAPPSIKPYRRMVIHPPKQEEPTQEKPTKAKKKRSA